MKPRYLILTDGLTWRVKYFKHSWWWKDGWVWLKDTNRSLTEYIVTFNTQNQAEKRVKREMSKAMAKINGFQIVWDSHKDAFTKGKEND